MAGVSFAYVPIKYEGTCGTGQVIICQMFKGMDDCIRSFLARKRMETTGTRVPH